MIETFIFNIPGHIDAFFLQVSSDLAFVLGIILARLKSFLKYMALPFKWGYKLIIVINALVHFNNFIKDKGWKYLALSIFKVFKYLFYFSFSVALGALIILAFVGCSGPVSLSSQNIDVILDANVSNTHKDTILRDNSFDDDDFFGETDVDNSTNINKVKSSDLSAISKMLLSIKLSSKENKDNVVTKKDISKHKMLSVIENKSLKANIRKSYVQKKKILGNLNNVNLMSKDSKDQSNFFYNIKHVSQDTLDTNCNYKDDTICAINVHRLDLIRKDLQYNVVSDSAYFDIFNTIKSSSKLKKTYLKIRMNGKIIFNNFAFPFHISKSLKLAYNYKGLTPDQIDIDIYKKRISGVFGHLLLKKKVNIHDVLVETTKIRFLNLINSYFMLTRNRNKCRAAGKTCYKENMFLKLIPLQKMNMMIDY